MTVKMRENRIYYLKTFYCCKLKDFNDFHIKIGANWMNSGIIKNIVSVFQQYSSGSSYLQQEDIIAQYMTFFSLYVMYDLPF